MIRSKVRLLRCFQNFSSTTHYICCHLADQQQAAGNHPRSTFASANSAFVDYPTFKLDRNTVLDTSMKWER